MARSMGTFKSQGFIFRINVEIEPEEPVDPEEHVDPEEPVDPEPTAAKLPWSPPTLLSPQTVAIGTGGLTRAFEATDTVIATAPSGDITGRINLSDGQRLRMIGGSLAPSSSVSGFALAAVRFQHSIFLEGLNINCTAASIDGIKAGGDVRTGTNPTLYTDTYIQNCRIMGVHGTEAGLHADCYQLDYMCKRLRFARCTMASNYQWLFLHPKPTGQPQLISQGLDIRDCNFRHNGITPMDAPSSRKPLFLANDEANLLETTHAIQLTNVWCEWADVTGITIVSPNASAGAAMGSDSISPYIHWPDHPTRITDKDGRPGIVRVGVPPGGDFCPSGTPGANYVSPGYV